MPTLDSPEMMRAIIMDHYEYPRNKKLKGEVGYLKVHMDSESCIDDIYIEALIQDGIIKEFIYNYTNNEYVLVYRVVDALGKSSLNYKIIK